MNVFILCIFAAIPFSHAAVHDVHVMNCPDFSQVLSFENKLKQFQNPSISSESPSNETNAANQEQIFTESTAVEPPELEIVPEKQVVSPQIKAPGIADSRSPAHGTEPLPMEMPEDAIPVPIQIDPNIQLASAVEPLSNEMNPPQVILPTISDAQAKIETARDVPLQRPWGVLTFFIFMLLLSISVNIFLGWQLIEVRKAKLK